MSRAAAYVIPMSEVDEEMMVLLGRERSNRKWSGFGGGLQRRESPAQGAAREAWEESLGYLGKINEIKPHLVLLGEVKETAHTYYTLPIEYDEKLPMYYHMSYDFIRTCGKKKLEKHCSEKIQIAWVSWTTLKHAVMNGVRQLGRDMVLQPTFFHELDEILRGASQ
jgi:ADP-ribose pyrophosphatase YjhB (NUDIX family)